MAPKSKQPRRFAVIGRGAFPVDMLRYDRACPWQERDSALIQDEDRERVVLVESWGHGAPEYRRWSSFGWCAVLVDAHETREAICARLLAARRAGDPANYHEADCNCVTCNGTV